MGRSNADHKTLSPSETSGRPEWPNLPAGEKPLMHGNHDEAILYANKGNHFAWISNDRYHFKHKVMEQPS